MTSFRKNPALEVEIAKLPGTRKVLEEAAQAVAHAARSIAPHKTRRGYKQSIEVGRDANSTTVYTTDIAGHLVEYGSAKNPAYAPIRRAVRAAGLRLDETSK